MALPKQSGFDFHDHAANPLSEGEFLRSGDNILTPLGLLLGSPNARRGFGAGEGPFYTTDLAGTTIVKAFKYDASAASGSRFTEYSDLGAQNTWLGDASDRFYVGCTNKFWAIKFAVGVAKTAEILDFRYWNGALIQAHYMGIKATSISSLANRILEQTVEQEIIMLSARMDNDWVAADDVLDAIPNTGTNMYWVCFLVPAGGLATPPRVDDITIRGTSFSVCSNCGITVLFGHARFSTHDRLPVDIYSSPAGTPSVNIDITSTQEQRVYQFRTNLNDTVSFFWKVPHGIDTSCAIHIDLDYAASAVIDAASILLKVRKLTDGTIIDNAQISDYQQTTNIVVAAGDTFRNCKRLTAAAILEISDLLPDDVLAIEIERTDNNGSNFYPLLLNVHHTKWSQGSHL